MKVLRCTPFPGSNRLLASDGCERDGSPWDCRLSIRVLAIQQPRAHTHRMIDRMHLGIGSDKRLKKRTSHYISYRTASIELSDRWHDMAYMLFYGS